MSKIIEIITNLLLVLMKLVGIAMIVSFVLVLLYIELILN